MIKREKINAEEMFINLGYTKIWSNNGFFFHNSESDKTIEFDLKNKKYLVYDYDTAEKREYTDKELKAILFQEQELGWISWKEYKSELNNI